MMPNRMDDIDEETILYTNNFTHQHQQYGQPKQQHSQQRQNPLHQLSPGDSNNLDYAKIERQLLSQYLSPIQATTRSTSSSSQSSSMSSTSNSNHKAEEPPSMMRSNNSNPSATASRSATIQAMQSVVSRDLLTSLQGMSEEDGLNTLISDLEQQLASVDFGGRLPPSSTIQYQPPPSLPAFLSSSSLSKYAQQQQQQQQKAQKSPTLFNNNNNSGSGGVSSSSLSPPHITQTLYEIQSRFSPPSSIPPHSSSTSHLSSTPQISSNNSNNSNSQAASSSTFLQTQKIDVSAIKRGVLSTNDYDGNVGGDDDDDGEGEGYEEDNGGDEEDDDSNNHAFTHDDDMDNHHQSANDNSGNSISSMGGGSNSTNNEMTTNRNQSQNQNQTGNANSFYPTTSRSYYDDPESRVAILSERCQTLEMQIHALRAKLSEVISTEERNRAIAKHKLERARRKKEKVDDWILSIVHSYEQDVEKMKERLSRMSPYEEQIFSIAERLGVHEEEIEESIDQLSQVVNTAVPKMQQFVQDVCRTVQSHYNPDDVEVTPKNVVSLIESLYSNHQNETIQ